MADKTIMKQITEQKLKAFSIGTMGKRPLSKKELEEQRKKEQEQAAAQAFEEFVATFQETPSKTTSKVWVKAGTYDAGKRQEDTREKGKLYKPQSKISELVENRSSAEQAQEYARLLGSNERKLDRLGKKKKEGEKKKSNLELFKEELKMIQEEREERHKYKGVVKTVISTQSEDPMMAALKCVEDGSFDNGDPNTTNLYLGNLNPKITEQQLMEIFGKYGPLASIKIMWPRSDEEKARQRNCGFVAFMSRKDGERALKNLNGRDIMQYEMKLGWGKSVPIPPYPIYIPPALMEITQPPPPSGLPFNAQPHRRDRHKIPRIRNLQSADPQEKENFEKVLQNAVVKVVIPTERNLVMLIHRMVEFVIREGPMFEAMIMNRELNNPMFRFLFENYSPAHTYYRWKLYSILQGDGQKEWRTEDFRMFKGGSVWRPPPINPWTQGMPDELIEMEERQEPRRGSLSNSQRDRLEDLLRNISPERIKVAEAMVFCIEHAEAAEEICDCISESLSILQTPVNKKIARLYLISDVLHNCGVKVTNATIYRKAFETRLLDIFNEVHQAYKQFDSRLKAEGFKARVMRMFRAWEDWAVYPRDFLVKLQNTFLGLVMLDEPEPENEEDIDGAPLSDVDGEGGEDLDGVPLDGAALLKGAMKHGLTPQTTSNYDDIDGVPMDEDIDGVPMDDEDNMNVRNKEDEKKPAMPAGFVPSRWETVDPDQVEAQAMTTSKWEELGQNDDSNSQDASMDSSSRDYNEERRNRLREIEVKTMQYQDELESGRRTLKSGMTIQGQVEHYRKKLIRKSEREMKDLKTDDREDDRRREKKRSTTPESPSHYRDRRRSTSPSSKSNRYRSRSRSPRNKRRSRSPYKKRVPVTPSPPRIRRTPSPSLSSSRTSRRSPGSERNDRKRRGRSPSLSPPPPPRTSSKHRANSPPSPSPRKHRHKHKY
ncbi:U2 snRNP-associated SURP motif-containing protein-like isoform X1 [Vespa mandarinia]|uniref:U2 snRNP-associated SURP motif-containing protein n=1 Tax=Vespa crabro TaxID=7445 RepID=UPI00161159CF|nr:U2 snRNP-associated SURP motif-containing protein-like isoform X1 [Vespa mandarinia]XP_035724595.1 U2 snRNP-associated SURP motif-containing protein-like isoform X1 [Vespa mandarinia]XP_035724596.1 U2 snRNP-associated SURP motif-containing protein-like isoform X1 [Vespa mandarinia]XP_035724597.1 U2 snRNP-associated SURP motif-containing protein-like isoform X1 [Vespa mandarinia]XP_046837104.1 U2 snRNP-associated SURP motif-containing protein [Vespa crabro]XP_046837106.1 U2 snRNP-associated 